MSQRWLKDYERRRVGDNRVLNESWASSKYGNIPWREAQLIWLPSVGMSLGKTWSRLKKLWRSYKIASSTGEYRTQTAYEIVKLQAALDIPRSDFPELEGVMSDYEFEDQDQDHTTSYPDDWSVEDDVLRREVEAEAEAKDENDDWWISDY
jgi:hypothetical protein